MIHTSDVERVLALRQRHTERVSKASVRLGAVAKAVHGTAAPAWRERGDEPCEATHTHAVGLRVRVRANQRSRD